MNHDSEFVDNIWDSCYANLIAKVSSPKDITQFRPIAILPVIYKLFSKVLLFLAKPRMRQLRAPQFAFTAGFQTHEVVFIIRRVVEIVIEWNIPVWVADGDIKKAYDNTSICLLNLRRNIVFSVS